MPRISTGPKAGKFIPLPQKFRVWVSKTNVRGRRRSKQLKALDRAISDNFRQQDSSYFLAEWDIADCLDAWIESKGPGWEKNERNRTGIITSLKMSLSERVSVDKEAVRFVEAEQRRAIKKLFWGTTLQFRTDSFGGWITRFDKTDKLKSACKHHTITTGLKTGMVVGRANDARKIISNGWGAAAMKSDGVFKYLDYLPVVSAAVGGAKGTIDVAKVANAIARTKPMIKKNVVNFKKGDAQSAVKAVLQLLDSEIKSNSMSAVMNFSEAIANTILLTAGGGLAIAGPKVTGLVRTFADTAAASYFYIKAKKEIEIANKILISGDVDFRVFEASPVLGAYYVCTQDTSTLINLDFNQIGRLGFIETASHLSEMISPVVVKSGELIRNSNIYIKELKNHKNVIMNSYSQRSKLDKLTTAHKAAGKAVAGKIANTTLGKKVASMVSG